MNKISLAIAAIFFQIALFVVADSACSQASSGSASGAKRTHLQQKDLSIQGREVVQVRVDIEPGIVYPKHSHPGEEMVYVLEGLLQYTLEGKNPIILGAGEVLFIPYGVAHSVKNVGNITASEVATYVVEKDKPLLKLTQ